MSSYPIIDMFGELPESQALDGAVVEEVRLDQKTKAMSIALRLPFACPETDVTSFADAVKRVYGLSEVSLRLSENEHSSQPDLENELARLMEATPSARALFADCHPLINDGLISISLRRGGLGYAMQWQAAAEKELSQIAGRPIHIEFSSTGETSEETLAKKAEEKNRALIEEQKKHTAAKKQAPKETKRTLMGRKPAEEFTPISQITIETGKAVIRGKVFWTGHREIQKTKSTVLCFDITDYTGSVRVNKYLDTESAKGFVDEITPGVTLIISGKLTYNRFENDLVFDPDSITVGEEEAGRKDNAPVKRVELHFHTKMSAMDAVVDASDAIRRAAAWGHPAIAITDHGVVQSFPEAMSAAAKINKDREGDQKLKVLYGTECYFVNNIERVRSVYGNASVSLDDAFVAFDIETTGLSRETDRIIEIGAVRFQNGRIVDTFNTFVDPERTIPQKIVELTGITDEMVQGAPSLREAIETFLNFAGDRVLAAHNATFDVDFITRSCRELGIDYAPTFIDTRNMSRGLLPTLKRFDLDTISAELAIPEFNHHRASDDAGAVAYILFDFLRRMKEAGVADLSEVNAFLAEEAGKHIKSDGGSNHMILLARNETGIYNLYQLISLSHLKYFNRTPVVPRSELDRHREGLIVGSACEAGELFKALVNGASHEDLIRIASYYDYLEIQPIGNNEFLMRSGKVSSKEELQDLNRRIVELGDELGKPVCATCDVHFMEPRDEIFRRILMSDYDDGDTQAPLYFRTTEEMLEEFAYLGEEKAYEVVVTNTNKIAALCDYVKPVRDGTYPPEIKNSMEQLRHLVETKLHRLYGDDPLPEVMERLNTEMSSIEKHHFDVLYMIAQKLVAKSLEDGYLVGSRGSVGSSVVAFFSDITEVNALPPHYRCPNCKHHEFSDAAKTGPDLPDKLCPVCGTPYEKDGFDIPFATFLGFDGDKKPDIDLNFSGEYQARAHAYTGELFGEGHVFRAGTIGTLKDKNAYGYIKKYAEKRGITFSKAEENRLIAGIVGVKKSTGQHPGGLIVVPEGYDINQFTPVQHPADKGDRDVITSHFDYHSIEENLLKLDELGHDDPTMIRMLQDLTGVDPQKIPLDDPETMSLFTSTKALGFENDPICGDRGTFAVPEFGTSFVRGMLQDTNPTTFDELLRISGLSHGTDVWLGNGKVYIAQGVATLKDIISARDDIMLYLISKGLDRKLAFTIMESVRKGRGLKPEWEPEMKAHDVPEWYMESCKKIKYMFPKGHAAAYVLMAFRIAWFKVHRPLEFYCTYFSIRAKSFDASVMTVGFETAHAKLKELYAAKDLSQKDEDMVTTLEVVYEFYRRGFIFDKMDVYRSDAEKFVITEDGKLLPPFTSLPGVGDIAAREIVAQRQQEKFLSVEELQLRCSKVSKAVVEQLAAAGALDAVPATTQVSLF